jgi:serine/threonine protein kinase
LGRGAEEKLSTLHEKGFVHGDIRLANLLSSGFIVDFDFVGLITYPIGLISVSDSTRHPDVSAAIDDGTIGNLEPTKDHDLFSMAFVLSLFTSEHEWWQTATSTLKEGRLSEAIKLHSIAVRDRPFS